MRFAVSKRLNRVVDRLKGTPSRADLVDRASAARARGDWSADVFYRRVICETDPGSARDWVQYGHALKELGMHSKAHDAYSVALDLMPGDAEISLQLAHLAKIRGRFEDALTLYAEAKRLGHAEGAAIDSEIGRLKRASLGRIYHDAPRDQARAGVRIFVSVPSGRISENDKQSIGTNLAAADYSYAFAMRGFLQALEALNIQHTVVKHPEYIADIRPRSAAAINIHLGFYPPEGVRLLKGAYNINCCAWEFDRLKSPAEIVSYHAFADPVTMLNLADEVWAPSHSAVGAFEASGVSKPVRMVTSPVLSEVAHREGKLRPTWTELDTLAQQLSEISWQPLAVMPRVQPAANHASESRRSSLRSIIQDVSGERPPPIFLSIFNIHDMRKNIRGMIEGFLTFSRAHPDALLLLKISTPSRGIEPVNKLLFEEQLFVAGDMFPPLISDRIWLTDQVLTRDEMNSLYDVASFYVCTSHGEGQNLPLVEAMGRGLLAISVNNTAMADYVRPDNAVIIPSIQDVFNRRLTRRYGMYGAKTYYSSPADVSAAFEAAVALPDDRLAELSCEAVATIRRQFGVEPFEAAIREVISRLTLRGEAGS